PAISVRAASMRPRQACSRPPGGARWASARRVQGSRLPCRRRPETWYRPAASAPLHPVRTRTRRPMCSTASTPGTRCDPGRGRFGGGRGFTCEGRDVPAPRGAAAALRPRTDAPGDEEERVVKEYLIALAQGWAVRVDPWWYPRLRGYRWQA